MCYITCITTHVDHRPRVHTRLKNSSCHSDTCFWNRRFGYPLDNWNYIDSYRTLFFYCHRNCELWKCHLDVIRLLNKHVHSSERSSFVHVPMEREYPSSTEISVEWTGSQTSLRNDGRSLNGSTQSLQMSSASPRLSPISNDSTSPYLLRKVR